MTEGDPSDKALNLEVSRWHQLWLSTAKLSAIDNLGRSCAIPVEEEEEDNPLAQFGIPTPKQVLNYNNRKR